jgi:multiple sugar transport system substrate-binding protein
MRDRRGFLIAAMMLTASTAFADDAKPYAGVALTLASQNDAFAGVLVALAPKFEAQTGIKVSVDVLSYPELLTKVTADFLGKTAGYDLITTDNVWSGQFAESGYTVVLDDWIKRDAAEIDTADIYPVLMSSLGGYKGHQIAFPFAGYANVLAVRTDLYQAAGLAMPATMQEMVADAEKLTDRQKGIYGWVANGQKGPAVAQDWMQYNSQLGGSILAADGTPALNSPANIQSLTVYKKLFDDTAPPGAVDYDWGGREESFRQGLVANMQTWSVGAAAYGDPAKSKIVGKFAITLAPPGQGLQPTYGVGGWGMAINASSAPRKQEAAWTFIKWITGKAEQKEMALMGGGGVIRRSTTHDPELVAKFPFYGVIDTSFEHGNGEFRPRIPQYPEIQDILGTAVNAVLVGNADPKTALDEAQRKALKLF